MKVGGYTKEEAESLQEEGDWTGKGKKGSSKWLKQGNLSERERNASPNCRETRESLAS